MKLCQVYGLTATSLAVSLATGLSAQTATAELFISEYVEGSSNNKAIEIYNPGSEPVDLSAYELQRYANGSAIPTTETQPLSGTIAPGDVYVVANPAASTAILAVTDLTSSVASFNGDDVVELLNGGATIDVIGEIGFDPGTEWSNGGVSTLNQTLRRNSDVCVGDADGSDPFLPDAQWQGFPVDSFDGLGAHSVTCTVGSGPEPPNLVISEIMYNPASAEDDWEWVEVYNAGSEVVDLSGYVIDDSNSTAHEGANIASGSIPPGGSAILFNAEDLISADFAAAWGTGLNLIPVTNWSTMALNNSGDTVGLWTSFASYSGDNQAQVNALVTVPYPDIDDGMGSIYLTDLAADPTNAASWTLSTVGASTPVGTAYQSTAAGGNSGNDVASPEAATSPVIATLIHAVQGSGATTPLAGQTVRIQGIVIADYQDADQLNGFFVQEEDTDQDSDPLTSEGIFISAPGAIDVATGDEVVVTGEAALASHDLIDALVQSSRSGTEVTLP
jgi:predicted extracellular nuclease